MTNTSMNAIMVNVMRKILLSICVSISVSAYGQSARIIPKTPYPELFKTLSVEVRESDALWIRMMYSEQPNFFEVVREYEKYYNEHPFEKTVHTQNYKHFYRMVSTNHLYDGTGKIEIDRTYNEIAVQAGKIKENGAVASESVKATNQVSTSPWRALAPYETFEPEGRKKSMHVNVYTIAQSKSNPVIMYAGTETGALFKSIDKAENWSEVGASVLNYGAPVAIKIDPLNADVVYVLYTYYLVKSVDGGATWSVVLAFTDGRDIEISPVNSNYLYLAGEPGLRQSMDGGVTWQTKTTDPVIDIEFKADDPNTIFYAQKNTVKNCYVIYKSTDNLQTTFEKTNGWFVPTNATAHFAGGAKIATTPADPNRVYVLLLGNDIDYATDLNFLGIYRSDNAGESWTLPYDGDSDGQPDNNPGGPYSCTHWSMSSFGVCGGTYDQGYYNADIDVSDTDPNLLLVGMLNLFKSSDGAKTFKWHGGYGCTDCGPGYRHPDIQDIFVQGSDVWVASDGGLDKYDIDLEFIEAKNKGITTCDLWGFDQGWNEDVLVGGRYHNGNMAYMDSYLNGNTLSLGGGENPTGFVNLGDNLVIYHDDIGGRKIPRTLPTDYIEGAPDPELYPNSWGSRVGSEFVNDPRYYNTIYFGRGNILYKSTDYGQSNSILKEFGSSTTKVTGIEVSRTDPQLIFVGQHLGNNVKFWRTTDAGATWSELTLPIATHRFSFSLNENNELYLAFDIAGNSTNKVFKSVDLGQSWTNLTSTALNGLEILDTEVQLGTNGGVYVVAENKVFYRNNSMSDWLDYSEGLPVNFRLLESKPFYKKSKLRLAGNRGVWERDFYEPSVPQAQPMVAQTFEDCGRQGIQFDDYSALDHTGATWTWSFPGATSVSSTSVRNPVVTYTNSGVYDVTLTVQNPNGSSTKTISQMITVRPSVCSLDTIPGKVISFNGATQYLSHSLETPKSLTHFTLTAWVKPNGIQPNYSSIFYSNSTTSNTSISLDFKNSRNELGTHCGGKYSYNSGLVMMPDKWNFVALIYTPTRVTLMLNDQYVTINGSYGTHLLESFDIGSHNRNSSRQFNGEIEEVHLYDRSLSRDEIRLNNHLIRRENDDPNLFAHFQFNDVYDGIIYDVRNNHNLTINGSATVETSTAPVGSGVSQMINVTGSGTYDFTDAGIKLNIDGWATGKVVVSRIFQAPSNPKQNVPIEGNEYWFIDNYREFGIIDDVTSTVITSQRNWSSDNASDIAMHVRYTEDFAASDWWTTTASSLTRPDIVTIPSGAYDWSCQFYLGRATETVTWTGNTSNQWNVATNWNTGSVPSATHNVSIPLTANKPVIASGYAAQALKVNIASSASLTIEGTLTAPSGLMLADGAALIAGFSNYSGTVTVQRQVAGQRGWRVVYNPFATFIPLSTLAQYNGLTINQAPAASSITDTRLFDQSTANWLNNTSDIPSATPFAMFIRGLKREVTGGNYTTGPNSFNMEIGGTLNSHPFSISPLVATPKFSLIGNPFLAPVNSSALTNGENIPYYMYQITEGNTSTQKRTKSGGWVAVMSSSTVPVPVLGVIAYQPANTSAYSVSSSDINLTSAPSSGYLTNKPNNRFLQLDLKKEGLLRDRLFLRQHPLATSAHSDRMDLVKFSNEISNFYLAPGNASLAVDARNEFGDPIPLIISSDTGWHTITVEEYTMPEQLEVYLQDRLMGIETLLVKGSKYDFQIHSGALSSGKDRFQLIFKGTSSNRRSETTPFQVVLLGNIIQPGGTLNFKVSGQKVPRSSYRIIGLNGMIYKSGVILEGNHSLQLGPWARGGYILQVENESKTLSKRFVIQ